MRQRRSWWIGVLLLGGGVLYLARGQGQEPMPTSQATPQAVAAASTPAPPRGTSAELNRAHYSPLQQQFLQSARRGADWLHRANRPDGRFVYGFLPDLNSALEGDHYLHQAGAAYALARAAHYLQEERYTVRARQAVLALLVDTAVDEQNPHVRHTRLPSVAVNRLGAAGLLVLAIHELPTPGDDLVRQSDQLCGFIRGQQQANGSLSYTDHAGDNQNAVADPVGINLYPGMALYALMRSQRAQPQEQNIQVMRKALPFYLAWWKNHKNMELAAWHIMAYSEAYLQTGEKVFADAVFEMSDWLCALQYDLDPRHAMRLGGFMSWQENQPVREAPHVRSALYAEGLADACRVARTVGDVQRYQQYREALERCLQFLTTLQYTEANTRHFTDWYRPALLGAFHASHQDGNLRIDYTQHAVSAMVQYLNYLADQK